MATFNEAREPTSRKFVAEQGIVMPNWSKIFQTFWSHSTIFALEKQPKNLNFHSFFISKRIVGGYFQGNMCTHFRKYVSEPGTVIPNLSEKHQFLCSHSSIFALEQQPIPKIMLGGYFQWNVWAQLQKIFILSRHQHSKCFRET